MDKSRPARFGDTGHGLGRLSQGFRDRGVTVDSLLGNHGRAPQSAGEKMLRAYPEAVLATDAHNLQRCSGLSVGYAWVRDRIGAERARADRILARLLARA